MALLPMNLRLEAPDGSGGEEYRIREGEIEVRAVPAAYNDDWQPLSSNDLADHVQRNSVVAQWLRHRIGWRRLLLKCTDHETLQKFGIAQTTSDRFAA
jgi:hypothetical protein